MPIFESVIFRFNRRFERQKAHPNGCAFALRFVGLSYHGSHIVVSLRQLPRCDSPTDKNNS